MICIAGDKAPSLGKDCCHMPTYEYECRKCGHEFEFFQNITADPLKKCPRCRGQLRRKIGSGAGLIFKGSGFYITDYRSEGYRKAAQADSATARTASEKPAKPGAKPGKAAKKSKTAAG